MYVCIYILEQSTHGVAITAQIGNGHWPLDSDMDLRLESTATRLEGMSTPSVYVPFGPRAGCRP